MSEKKIIETARLEQRVRAYEDDSGHHYIIRAIRRYNVETCLAHVVIEIETGGDVAEIPSDDWECVRDAVDRLDKAASECEESP